VVCKQPHKRIEFQECLDVLTLRVYRFSYEHEEKVCIACTLRKKVLLNQLFKNP
jgi:hypothetical protein